MDGECSFMPYVDSKMTILLRKILILKSIEPWRNSDGRLGVDDPED